MANVMAPGLKPDDNGGFSYGYGLSRRRSRNDSIAGNSIFGDSETSKIFRDPMAQVHQQQHVPQMPSEMAKHGPGKIELQKMTSL